MTTPSKPELKDQTPGNILRHVEALRGGVTDRNRQQTLCAAAKALRDLSRDSTETRVQIVAAGAILVLSSILRNNNSSQILLQAATSTLMNLASNASSTQEVRLHAAAPLGVLLRRPGMKNCVLEQATGVLNVITHKNWNAAAAFFSSGAIPAMLQLIASQGSSETIILNCVSVAANLSAFPTVSALLDADIVPGLLQLLQHPSRRVQDAAALALSGLAICSKPAKERLTSAGAVQALISMVQKGNCTASMQHSVIDTLYFLLKGSLVIPGFRLAAARGIGENALLCNGEMRTITGMSTEQQGRVVQHVAEQLVAAGGVEFVTAVLQVGDASDSITAVAISIIILLIDNNSLDPQSASSAIPTLVQLLEQNIGCSNPVLVTVVQTLLIRLVIGSPSRSAAAAACGCIPAVCSVLTCSTSNHHILQQAAALVEALASASRLPGCGIQAGFQRAGVLLALQKLLAHGNSDVVSSALLAFKAISEHAEHKTPAGEAISSLLALVRDRATEKIGGLAAKALKELCTGHEANACRLAAAGAVPILTHILNTLDTSEGMPSSVSARLAVPAVKMLKCMVGIDSTSSAVTAALPKINFSRVLNVNKFTGIWQVVVTSHLDLFGALLQVENGPQSIIACGGVTYLIAIVSRHQENTALVEPVVNFLARLTDSYHPQVATALAARGIPVLSRLCTHHDDGSVPISASTMQKLSWLLEVLQGHSSSAGRKKSIGKRLAGIWAPLRGHRVCHGAPSHLNVAGSVSQLASQAAPGAQSPSAAAQQVLSRLALLHGADITDQHLHRDCSSSSSVSLECEGLMFPAPGTCSEAAIKMPSVIGLASAEPSELAVASEAGPVSTGLPSGIGAASNFLGQSAVAAGGIECSTAAACEPGSAGQVTESEVLDHSITCPARHLPEESTALDTSMQALKAVGAARPKQKGAKMMKAAGEAEQQQPPACLTAKMIDLPALPVDPEPAAVPAEASSPAPAATADSGQSAKDVFSKADKSMGTAMVRVPSRSVRKNRRQAARHNYEPSLAAVVEEDTLTGYDSCSNLLATPAISLPAAQQSLSKGGGSNNSSNAKVCQDSKCSLPAVAANHCGHESSCAAHPDGEEEWTVLVGKRRVKVAHHPVSGEPVVISRKQSTVAVAPSPPSRVKPGKVKPATHQQPAVMTAVTTASPTVVAEVQSSQVAAGGLPSVKKSAQHLDKASEQLPEAATAVGPTASSGPSASPAPAAAGSAAAAHQADAPSAPVQCPASEGLWTIAGMLHAVVTCIPAGCVRDQLKQGITTSHPWRQQQPRLILPWLKLELESLLRQVMEGDLPGPQEVLGGILDLQENVAQALRQGPPVESLNQQQLPYSPPSTAAAASKGVQKVGPGLLAGAYQPPGVNTVAGGAANASTAHNAEGTAVVGNTTAGGRARRRRGKGRAQASAAAIHPTTPGGLLAAAMVPPQAEVSRPAGLAALTNCLDASNNCNPTDLSTPKALAAAAVGAQQSATTSEDSACCIVCMDAARSVLLLPCRHFVLCEECAAGFKPINTGCSNADQVQCPVCRTAVEGQWTIFMA